jgi:protein-L-isoaspartate(D-aspartate) O-methyltransferase
MLRVPAGVRTAFAFFALPVCLAVWAACAPPPAGQQQEAAPPGRTLDADRARMVESQLAARGIKHPGVLEAMRRVPRDRFVPLDLQSRAYEDGPLPIGDGQTISQPYIVAYMTEALDPQKTDRVLEIGTGSGYQAAVLAELVAEVYTIEIVPALAERARAVLNELGYRNVRPRQGDGYAGWPEAAPFDKIIVTAAPPEVPQALVDQLAADGVMVVPVGGADQIQMMTILRKTPDGVVRRETMPVRFVPMIKKS